MDAALHSVDRSRCVKLGQTRAGDTICELCYGTGCKNGYRAACRMGYVISLQLCDGYYSKVQGLSFISSKVISLGYPALSCYRVDCKHCYEGRPEVCVEVHG